MTLDLALTPFQQRIAAAALAAVPALVLLMLLGGVVSDLADHHDEVSTLKRERADYQVLADNAESWRRDIAQFEAASAGAELFYSGNAAAGAGSQMQVALSEIVSKNGGTLLHAGSTPAEPGSAPGATYISAAFETDIAGLTKILHAVREARPLLLPKHLIVRRRDGTSAAGPTHLDVELDVEGFASAP